MVNEALHIALDISVQPYSHVALRFTPLSKNHLVSAPSLITHLT
jgi:hypothetical protein